MAEFTPSPQQAAVYRWVQAGSGNLILVAVAGAGKTYTLLESLALMSGSIAVCAYNKKIADEIEAKIRARGMGRNVQAGTFHRFGFSAWRRVAPKVQVDDKKMYGIVEQLKVPLDLQQFVLKLTSLAKSHAIGVLHPFDDMRIWWQLVNHHDLDESLPDTIVADGESLTEVGISFAMQALKSSASMDREVIDFDDMIYAPLLHDAKVWQNDWILVDEAQDTNPARRALAKKMLRPGGRAIFVGDPCQAIYGFTGADNDSLDIIKREFAATELPLTVTYRCPKAVVREAQKYVNHITAADEAPEGVVKTMPSVEFDKLTGKELTHRGAMLCRLTAPLVATAFGMIRRGVPCQVEGRDIGRGLLVLALKMKTPALADMGAKLDEYLRRETEKFLAKGQEQKAQALQDKVETLHVIIDALPEGATMNDLRGYITKLFGDTPEGQAPKVFTLSTVHKSKGREWDTVYILDRQKYMPSRFARQDWQLQQERNLIYVAITRSQGTLVEVVS